MGGGDRDRWCGPSQVAPSFPCRQRLQRARLKGKHFALVENVYPQFRTQFSANSRARLLTVDAAELVAKCQKPQGALAVGQLAHRVSRSHAPPVFADQPARRQRGSCRKQKKDTKHSLKQLSGGPLAILEPTPGIGRERPLGSKTGYLSARSSAKMCKSLARLYPRSQGLKG